MENEPCALEDVVEDAIVDTLWWRIACQRDNAEAGDANQGPSEEELLTALKRWTVIGKRAS